MTSQWHRLDSNPDTSLFTLIPVASEKTAWAQGTCDIRDGVAEMTCPPPRLRFLAVDGQCDYRLLLSLSWIPPVSQETQVYLEGNPRLQASSPGSSVCHRSR